MNISELEKLFYEELDSFTPEDLEEQFISAQALGCEFEGVIEATQISETAFSFQYHRYPLVHGKRIHGLATGLMHVKSIDSENNANCLYGIENSRMRPIRGYRIDSSEKIMNRFMEEINKSQQETEFQVVQLSELSPVDAMALSDYKGSAPCLGKEVSWGNLYSNFLEEESFMINPSMVYDACDKIV